MKRPIEVIVVTGLSGSGKSTAIRALEDLGFYCIDNLPVVLIRPFLELCEQSAGPIDRVALGIDLRERAFFAECPRALEELRRSGYQVEVLFLDASDEALLRRFSETRRPHPLGGERGAGAGIAQERALLAGLRALATRLLDTSALTTHELRQQVRELYRPERAADAFTVFLVSFGYKFGVPADVDMLLDVRFLANPFFVHELRPQSGLDPAVAAFVLERPEAQGFLQRTLDLLEYLLPLYQREGKSYFTVGLGCTGGRHRSVALADALAQRLQAWGYRVHVRHRDLEQR